MTTSHAATPEMQGERRRFPWVRLVIVLLLVLFDQWSKTAVFEWLEDPATELVRDDHRHMRYPLAGQHLTFMTSLNKGAAFGRFGDYPHLLVGGRVLAVLVLTWLLLRIDRRHRVTLAAIVLVIAGALGNLLDNLFFGGIEEAHPYRLVRDFIDVYFHSEAWGWDWHFPTFNVADSCISVGAVGWVLAGLFHREPPEPQSEPDEAATPAVPEGIAAPVGGEDVDESPDQVDLGER